MKRILSYAVAAVGVVCLGIVGWLFVNKDKLTDKLFDDIFKD